MTAHDNGKGLVITTPNGNVSWSSAVREKVIKLR
jgi:hypothetical protein